MNTSEKCAEIRRNLTEFYSTSDSKRRSALNEWLTNVLNDEEVWNFCWTLLTPGEDLQVQLFASNCVYFKLTSRFSAVIARVSYEELEKLRELLLDLPPNFSNAAVRSKLCASLAVFVLHTLPDVWPNPVETLAQRWSAVGAASSNLPILLDVFSDLVLEFRKLSLPLERRNVVRSCLKRHEAAIANCAAEILQRTMVDNCEIAESAIRCIESWIEFDGNASLSDWQDIVVLCLNKVNESVDLVSCVSKFFQNFVENLELSRMETFVAYLFEYAANLVSMSSKFERTDDAYEDLVKMVIALGSNQTKILLKLLKAQSLSAKAVVEFVLDLSSPNRGFYPVDETLSVLTIPFWYNVHEEGTVLEDKEILNANLTQLRPYFGRLLDQLIVKIQYPSDAIYSSQWSFDDKEKFAYYRIDSEDTLACCFRIIGSTMTEYLLHKLKSMLLNAVNLTWQSIESIFLAYQSIGEYVTVANVYVVEFLTTVFPRTSHAFALSTVLANTALTVISKYNHVIIDRQLIPVYVSLIVPFLADASCVTNATLALRDLCSSREPVLRSVLLDDLISPVRKCFENRSFQDLDRLRVLSCYGYVLSLQPPDVILRSLNELLAPRLERLQNLNDSNYYNSRSDLLFEFDVVSTLIDCLSVQDDHQIFDGPKPVFLVISQSLDLFQSIYTASQGDHDVTVKLCQILKGAVVALCGDLSPLIDRYCQLLLIMYDRPQRACVIGLAKSLYLMFAIDRPLQPLLATVFNRMLSMTPAFLTTSASGANNNSHDSVEAFLSFCHSLAKKNWTFFSSYCNTVDVVNLACRCLADCAQDSMTIKEATVLLCEYFKHSESEYVRKIVEDYGNRLILGCFERIKTEILTSCLEYVADVMFILCSNYAQHLMTWRRLLPEHHLVSSMMAELGNKRKFREFAKQINIGCRRNVLTL